MITKSFGLALAMALSVAHAQAQTDPCGAATARSEIVSLANATQLAIEADLRPELATAEVRAARTERAIAALRPADTVSLQIEDFPGTGLEKPSQIPQLMSPRPASLRPNSISVKRLKASMRKQPLLNAESRWPATGSPSPASLRPPYKNASMQVGTRFLLAPGPLLIVFRQKSMPAAMTHRPVLCEQPLELTGWPKVTFRLTPAFSMPIAHRGLLIWRPLSRPSLSVSTPNGCNLRRELNLNAPKPFPM